MTIGEIVSIVQEVFRCFGKPEVKDSITSVIVLTVICMSALQVSKLKVNPWSRVLRIIGKQLNKDIMDDINKIKEDVDTIKADVAHQKEAAELDKVLLARRNILSSADEIRRNIPHSEEYFTDILEDVDKYEHYCMSHPDFENAKAAASIELIKTTHFTNVKENKFV